MNGKITRYTWDGQEVTAPAGTNKCAQIIVRPHPSDLTHRLFAPDSDNPMLQLLTGCGRRAHRFVTEDEGKEVNCPECLSEEQR